jgi:hypothetical protein
VAARPEAQLLPNGDSLVPVRTEDGRGWQMARLTLNDAGYAERLAKVQKRERIRNVSGVSWPLSVVVLLVVLSVQLA